VVGQSPEGSKRLILQELNAQLVNLTNDQKGSKTKPESMEPGA
jgi:hypothetical protein